MSGHRSLAKFGWIEFEGQRHTLLTQLLDEGMIDGIDKFRKENRCGWSTVPWENFYTGWRIEKNSLFLIDVHVALCRRTENLIKEIFGEEKIFIAFDGKVRALKSEKIVKRLQLGRVLKELDIVELYFEKGQLRKKICTSKMRSFVYFQDYIEP